MSGQQIGSAVGFVAGFFLPGGPQVWATIGGMVGGLIAPTEMEGPHIGDGPQQSSNEGIPIAWVVGGSFGWLQGNIIDKSERREIRKEDDGKGSGQVAVTFEAHQDYCIMVCESSETRDSTVVGPLIIKMDGKIVYDMRPGKNFGAENAKFLKNHTFYTGGEDQMPDATMEAVHGVGNTPHYRGVFTCVARDINLTQYGDRIPVYEWVMVADGAQDDVTTESFFLGELPRFIDADWPLADPDSRYTMTGRDGQTGETSVGTVAGDIAEAFGAGYYIGYTAGNNRQNLGMAPAIAQETTVPLKQLTLLYSRFEPDQYLTTNLMSPASVDVVTELGGTPPDPSTVFVQADGAAFAIVQSGSPNPFPGEGVVGFLHFDGYPEGTAGVTHYAYGRQPVEVTVIRDRAMPVYETGDPCELGHPVLLPDSTGMLIDCNGTITPAASFENVSGTFVQLSEDVVVTEESRTVFTDYAVGPTIDSTDPDNTESYWTAQYEQAVVSGSMAPGLIYGVDYPATVTTAWQSTVTTSTIDADPAYVADSIDKIAFRGGLSAEEIDTVEVDQQLLGYGITNTYNGADCIRPLLTAYGLYGADYDGQIHFHKLGEDADIAIDPGEMIAGETQTDEAEREQAVEYPRLILLNYIDPDQDYTVRPQPWRRTSPDVRAIGEQTMQVPVVMAPDDAARTVDTYGKRATAKAQGTRKFSVPFAGANEVYLRLHPGKAFGLDSKRWVPDKVTIEDGEIAIEASFDRQSAYTSNVTAVPAPPPTPPPSNIGGVTLFAAMNLPRLRSKDNSPGMYIAVAGLLDNWPGCLLQMSIDDGASWTTAFSSMVTPSVMGYLTAGMDEMPSATLSVSVHGGDLNSITDAQLSDGGNPSAVVTAGIAEVLQFRDANELEPNEYDLTTLARGGLGTMPAVHVQGDRFVHLGNIYFLPLDFSLSGRTIKFRPVTFGTVPENNASYDVVYLPQFTGPQVIEAYTNDDGEPYTDDNGSNYFEVIS